MNIKFISITKPILKEIEELQEKKQILENLLMEYV
jgi:hypothetical protein